MSRGDDQIGRNRDTHRVVMAAFEDAQILDVVGPLEVFARTTRWLADHRGISPPAYAISIAAPSAGPLRTSGGILIHADRDFAAPVDVDTLLVAGGIGYRRHLDDRPLLDWLNQSAARAERVGSICTGSLLLAAAGLLDRKRATTHWAYGIELSELAPSAEVEADAIYVRDGRIYTSAGVTAGMDLALALVEEDWGRGVALAIAQELVLYLKRPGGQSQFSRMLEAQRLNDRFGMLESWMLDNLASDLTVPVLAERAAMSVRQFARRFRTEMRTTPAQFVEQLRVERAREALSEGRLSLKAIARNTGFRDVQRMRRAFRRHLGVTPAEYLERFG